LGGDDVSWTLLSKREREVIVVTAQTGGSKEAARALGISFRTVDAHLARAYEKLGVNRLTQAVILAAKAGAL
jgi:LuxR family maltose regulon positive regulatory protein